MSIFRFLKLADAFIENNEDDNLEKLCSQFEAFLDKHLIKTAHMAPDNDGKTPNPWRTNMDYDSWEGSPYFGRVADFLKKFPGGIREWAEWRKNTQTERNKLWDINKIKERKAHLENLMKTADDIGNPIVEEYSPTQEDIKEDARPATGEEKEKASNLVLQVIQSLIDSGEVSPEEVNEFLQKKYGLTAKAHIIGKILRRARQEYLEYIEKIEDGIYELEKDLYNVRGNTEEENHIHKFIDVIIEKLNELKKRKIEAHFIPVGPDDTKKFPKEPHLYENLDKYKDIKEYIKKWHKAMGKDADDVNYAMDAVRDFINYYKLLLKGKGKRKAKKGKK